MIEPDGIAIDTTSGWLTAEGPHTSAADASVPGAAEGATTHEARLPSRTLVAGVGNIFFADDGFGPAVARRLAARPQPEGVHVGDFGIRGVHLAYELSSGYQLAIVIDAVARGGAPGTLYVIDPELDGCSDAVTADAHGLDLSAVFATMRSLGAPPQKVVVVGCETAVLCDGIGLSEAVERSVDRAVSLVEQLLVS